MTEHPYKLIGVCLSTIHQENRFHLVKALNTYASANGYRLMIFNSCSDLYERLDSATNAGEAAVFQLIPYDMLSAMILFPSFLYDKSVVNQIVSGCKSHHLPLLSVDEEIEGCPVFSFSYEDTFEQLCDHVMRYIMPKRCI